MPHITQAAVLEGLGEPFKVADVEVEDPGAHEVLVKMTACGLCHTDIGLALGQIPTAFPCVPGHEGGGVVMEVGSSVTAVVPGNKVLLTYASCMNCPACSQGTPYYCSMWEAMNFGRVRADSGPTPAMETTGTGESANSRKVWGSFFGQSSMARHALVSESSVVKVPDDTDLKLFAPLGCGLQTGAGAVLNKLKVEEGKSIAIFGLGAVGMAAVLAAAHAKASPIIAVDLVQSRLDLAKEFGATHTVLVAASIDTASVIQAIKAPTKWDGAGVNYAVEASGSQQAWNMALASLGPGGHLASCGSPGPGRAYDVQPHDLITGAKSWSGVLMGCSNPRSFIPYLIDLHKAGKFPIERMTREYPLEDIDAAVAAMKDGSVTKPVIVF